MTTIELKEYLYDIVTLENQIHTYQCAEEIYVRKIRKIEEDKNTVFLNDKITSKIFTEINHDSNNTLKQTVSLYQNQLSDILQHS